MTYSTLASQHDLGRGRLPPARSIPNLPNDQASIVPTSDSYHLARSSSHPPEMWGRDVIDSNDSQRTEDEMHNIATATQTDNKIDIQQIESFILGNPRLVLNLLGIEPAYHINPADVLQPQPPALIPIPEVISSPDTSSPPPVPNSGEFIYGGSSHVWSPQNSNNKNTENCRSTDALLHSSDDCLRSDENLSIINLNETVNFSIIKEGSFKSLKHRLSDSRSDKSSSSNSLSSAATTTPKPSDNISSCVTATGSSTQFPTTTTNGGGISKRSSWKDSNSLYTTKNKDYNSENEDEADVSIEFQPDFDELNEKCALLCNEVRRSGSSRSSTTEIHKRNHLAPRAPVNYRFSAGDADKLEKGIKTIPSTRSLKES